MISKVKNLTQGTIITGTIIVTIGTFLSSVFNYTLQISLGRFLTVPEYGTFNALLSLAVVMMVPVSALVISLIKTVATLKAAEKFDTLTHLFISLTKSFMLVGAILFLLVFAMRFVLADYLNIKDVYLFIFFGIFLGISFLNINPSAYLQGLLRFKAFAFYISLGGLLRLTFAMALVFLGLGVAGAFIGMGAAVIVVFVVSLLLLKKNFTKYKEKEDLKEQYSGILRFGFVTLMVAIGMSMLNNMDVILVKHFFHPQSAGVYAALVTIGKVFLFGAGAVTILMYPQISGLYAKGEDYLPRFKQFLALQLVLILGGLMVFSFLPWLVVQLLFGENFIAAVPFVQKFSIFVAFYILVNFLIMFMLAIDNKKVWIFLVPAVILQYILLSLNHNTLNDIIRVNVLVLGLLLLSISVYCPLYLKNVRAKPSKL